MIDCPDTSKYILGKHPDTEQIGSDDTPIFFTNYSHRVDLGEIEYAYAKCRKKIQTIYKHKPKESAKDRAKQITNQLSQNTTTRPLTVLVVIQDSVSRQHFYRNFPLTIKFLNDTVVTGKYSQDVVGYDFLINNAHGQNSNPNVIPLIFGHDMNALQEMSLGLDHRKPTDDEAFKKIQKDALWKWYEKHGFVTMFAYDTVFDYLAKSLGKTISVDHTASNFWTCLLYTSPSPRDS